MRVATIGLWHLGSVTAACFAAAGHDVTGWDPDPATVEGLSSGVPPVAEPGLADLIRDGFSASRLRFSADLAEVVRGAEVVCITFDTPVDDQDRVDVDVVFGHAEQVLAHVEPGALVLISSQWPVGTTQRLEARWRALGRPGLVHFGYSPENLRLGTAIEVFRHPDRVVVGVRDDRSSIMATELFAPITNKLELMSVESAEMTKHAINAFLALSVTFINEIAGLCEEVGANARQVERGLRTEQRIGPRAYLSPGAAFAGGTLARDVETLRALGDRTGRETPLCDGISASNRSHAGWAARRVHRLLGDLSGQRIAVWGLTYKPGTDTLRRSSSVDLCAALVEAGADVHAHDPAAGALPDPLATRVTRHGDPLAAARGAAALVVATEWPAYRDVPADLLAAAMPAGRVIDANMFMGPILGNDKRFHLLTVGQPA